MIKILVVQYDRGSRYRGKVCAKYRRQLKIACVCNEMVLKLCQSLALCTLTRPLTTENHSKKPGFRSI